MTCFEKTAQEFVSTRCNDLYILMGDRSHLASRVALLLTELNETDQITRERLYHAEVLLDQLMDRVAELTNRDLKEIYSQYEGRLQQITPVTKSNGCIFCDLKVCTSHHHTQGK